MLDHEKSVRLEARGSGCVFKIRKMDSFSNYGGFHEDYSEASSPVRIYYFRCTIGQVPSPTL